MLNIAALSLKRRAAMARKSLEDVERNFNGKAPLPEELAVELRSYGCVWKGQSAIRVVLIGSRTEPLDLRLRLERIGPFPEDVIVDPERNAQFREAIAAVMEDLNHLKKLFDRPGPSQLFGGAAGLSERDIEVLRIFRFEPTPQGLVFSRPVETKG